MPPHLVGRARRVLLGGGLVVAACGVPSAPSGEPPLVLRAEPPSTPAVEPASAPIAVPVATTTPVVAPASPIPPPELPPGDDVAVRDLIAALELVAVDLERDPTMIAEYEAWVAAHGVAASDAVFRDYVRVRLVFECTRDGGLWQLRWDITNREPNSDHIWSQWKALEDFVPTDDAATAVAECDELSALFAHLVRRLGVQDVGLMWPVWNHVVAVWTLPEGAGKSAPLRIIVPTSQIMLPEHASLGTDGFDPWRQKTIFEYRRKDARDQTRIPAALARFFVERAWTGMRRSQADLQADRNRRSARLGGS